MKKYFSVLCACIMLLSLVGCGEAASTSTDTPSTSTSIENTTSTSTTVENTSSTENTPVEEPVVNNAISFSECAFAETELGFFSENSTELINCVMAIYPVGDYKAVLQFKYYDATEDHEIPVEANYAFTFEVADKNTLKSTSEDQAGDTTEVVVELNAEGEAVVTSNLESLNTIVGKYLPMDGSADIDAYTVLEFLRNIPEAEIGDFGLYNPYDEVEELLDGGWFHELILRSEDVVVGKFLVADDFSAILRNVDEDYSLIYGSLENTVKHVDEYEYYDEVADDYIVYPVELVYAYVVYGNEIVEGAVKEVFVEAPFNLVESITLSSSNEAVASVEGAYITGKSVGEAVVTATYKYGDVTATYELPVTVVAYDPETDFVDIEIVDEKYSEYQDSVSQRATLNICYEDGIYAVDILWADAGDITHHWSYIGTADKKGNLTLNGSYVIETYDGENYSEEVVFENYGATLTLGKGGCYYWHDDYEDAGKDCIFEPIA